jgi:hypothetical protein
MEVLTMTLNVELPPGCDVTAVIQAIMAAEPAALVMKLVPVDEVVSTTTPVSWSTLLRPKRDLTEALKTDDEKAREEARGKNVERVARGIMGASKKLSWNSPTTLSHLVVGGDSGVLSDFNNSLSLRWDNAAFSKWLKKNFPDLVETLESPIDLIAQRTRTYNGGEFMGIDYTPTAFGRDLYAALKALGYFK